MKKVMGVGVNDSTYQVTKKLEKGRWKCPYYRVWENMLNRCYGKSKKCYEKVTVYEDWLLFSNFKTWMESQDWEGKVLDKDLLSGDLKVYSPDNCVFLHHKVNEFIVDTSSRNELPNGVHYDKARDNFKSECRNIFTKKKVYLGRFDCPDEAHKVWKEFKLEMAKELCNTTLINCERVKKALIARYSS